MTQDFGFTLRPILTTSSTPSLIVTGVLTFVLLFLVFPNLPLPGESLDTMFGYTYDEAMGTMTEYSEPGRIRYIWLCSTLDTLLPIAYTGFFCGLIRRLQQTNWTNTLLILPISACCLDWAENMQLMVMMSQFPEVTEHQVQISSITTQMKFCIFGLTVLLVLTLSSMWLSRQFRDRNARKSGNPK